MPKAFFSKSKLIFLLFVALAFSLRSVYLNQTVKYLEPGSGSDSFFYLEWAKDIVRGNILGKEVFYALPVYPYFLSLAYLFSGGETFDLLLLQMLLGSINCGLIYLLGRKLFNESVGIIAATIASGYAMFIFYDRMLLPASLTVFLGLLSALLLLEAKDNPRQKSWLAAGLLLGLSTLTSASFFLLSIFISFWIIYEYKKSPARQILLYCLSFILPFLLIVAGVSLRNYLVASDPVLLTAHSGINFYIGNNPQANGLFKPPPYMRPTQSGLIEDAQIVAEKISARTLKASEMSRFWFSRSLSFIKTQPLNYLKLQAKKFALFWNGKEFVDDIEYYIFNEETRFWKFNPVCFSLICPLAILGMFLAHPQAKRAVFLYLFVFSLSLATISFFINARYRLVALPYLIIFAAFCFWQLLTMYKHKQYKGLILSLVLFSVLYLLTNIQATDAGFLPDFTFHYNQGVYFSDQKEYQKAQEEFQIALTLCPRDYLSYLGLGNLYYQMQDFEKAIDNYQKSLALNPYFYNAYFNLGLIYEKMGDEQKAEEQFKKVLELKPQDCAAHYNLGRLYQKKGSIEAALKEYQEALKIKPGHWEILKAIEELKHSQAE